MQTQTLPIQVSGASSSPAPQRANGAAASDPGQFSQALSREIEQRQHSPAPARQPAPAAKPQGAPNNQSTQAQAKPAESKPAESKPAEAKPATASADAGTGADAAREDAAAAAAASPVVDMLALVASFNQPLAAASAPAATPLAASAQATAALQVTDMEAYAATPAKAEIEPALTAAAGKALATAPGADDTGLAFKDVAQAVEGAARFSMKAMAGAAAPASILPNADAPGADRAVASLATGAAMQKPDLDGAAAAAMKAEVRTEPASKPAPLQADAAQPAPLLAREAAPDFTIPKEVAVAAPVTAPVQQASLAMAQAISGVATDKIAARVGTPGWDNQVAQKIVWMVAGKEQSASLTLNPPDMGPMQVVLSVTNDQATVTFSAAQPEVRQALENAMPKLREMMGESGIALGNATVNDGAQEQRQAQQGEQRRGHAGGGSGAEGAIEAIPRQARTGGGAGLVDTFA